MEKTFDDKLNEAVWQLICRMNDDDDAKSECDSCLESILKVMCGHCKFSVSFPEDWSPFQCYSFLMINAHPNTVGCVMEYISEVHLPEVQIEDLTEDEICDNNLYDETEPFCPDFEIEVASFKEEARIMNRFNYVAEKIYPRFKYLYWRPIGNSELEKFVRSVHTKKK